MLDKRNEDRENDKIVRAIVVGLALGVVAYALLAIFYK